MKIQTNYKISEETSFKCGGKASFYCEVEDIKEFCNLVKFHSGKLYVLGNGTKTLFSDNGFDGLVISTKKLNGMRFYSEEADGDEKLLLECECGVRFDDMHIFCAEKELGGLEFCAGIPASVGGAVIMNAGAFGDEIGRYVEKVEVFQDGSLKILHKNEISFSYRKSSLKNYFITKVWFVVAKSKKNVIINKQQLYLQKRFSSQPQGFANAGSVFKRSEGVVPAEIIDKLGLKGLREGGAMVSEKHAGFIVNTGNATASDIARLIDKIKTKVFAETGIVLEEELILVD